MMFMNNTFVSRGRLAMNSTASATFSTSKVGSTIRDPSACGTPLAIAEVISVAAFPMSIWQQAMSYFRPSSAVDFVKPTNPCFVAV